MVSSVRKSDRRAQRAELSSIGVRLNGAKEDCLVTYLIVIIISRAHDHEARPKHLLFSFANVYVNLPFLHLGGPVKIEYFVTILDVIVDSMSL